MLVRCYLEAGIPRIDFEPRQDVVLKRFFEVGIQSWPDTVQEVASAAHSVERGVIASWSGGGNDYVAELTGAIAKIWSHHEDREIEVPLPDFRRAAQAWLEIVASLDQTHLVDVDLDDVDGPH